jgi:LmeA-like phospholipid-binding
MRWPVTSVQPSVVRAVRGALALGLLLPLPTMAGCGGTNPFRSVERSIREQLPQLIGPADRYEVTVSRSSGSLIAGRIPWINIHSRNVRAIEGLTLDELDVRLEGVRFSRASRAVQEIGMTRFDARVSAPSVVRFIHHRSPNLRDVQVAFTGQGVRVHATPSLVGIGVPLEVEGRPSLRGSAAIDFSASRVAVLRLGLPEFAVRRLEERINPLVDLRTMPFPVHLTAVRVEDDRAVISGTATLDPARLKR